MTRTFGLSGDLPSHVITAAVGVALAGLVLLGIELWHRRAGHAFLIALTGAIASLFAFAALLRPVRVWSRSSLVGPKVVVLVDRSRSMLLPGDAGTRDDTARRAVQAIGKAARGARVSFVSFGDDAFAPLLDAPNAWPPARALHSSLMPALSELASRSEELPSAVVVVSDGRLDTPNAGGVRQELQGHQDKHRIPIHTVSVAQREPNDASLRAVHAAGIAVAHQPLHLTLEIGCSAGLSCDALPVTVHELLDGAQPTLLASGMAKVTQGLATLDLTITLDRAGPRLVQVALQAPDGDEIPDNNRRFLAFDVTRERVRVLHVAGRPTYDVRALRMWLKANSSVDVVAFFILRSHQDDVMASQNELALIEFPVRELFTEHLPSFDAVILQDFNAVPYDLLQYLPNLAKYVETGGGLVMVGGPDAFLGGGYAHSPLDAVLPVDLSQLPSQPAYDLGDMAPRVTSAGRAAPVLAALRGLFGDELPSMPGANLVGDAKPGSVVLWEHPTRRTPSGNSMPLLTLGESGDGRAVAIALDGAHRLGFSEAAARVAGRGHGALWDGLLGWLMRDPRFEPAQIDLPGMCIAGEPTSLRIIPLPGTTGLITMDVTAADATNATLHAQVDIPPHGGAVEVPIGALAPGGYVAKVRVGSGSTTRRAFPCERGGDEWADSRPDEPRLEEIAKATGGTFTHANDADSLRFPAATEVNAERNVTPVLPPWVWTLGAAVALGAHWIVRRRSGLT